MPTMANHPQTTTTMSPEENLFEMHRSNSAKETQTIGKRFAAIRKERGVTQVEMAERLGLSQNAISAYERGLVRISAPTLAKLADALGVSSDEIIGRKPSRDMGLPSRRVLRRAQRIDLLPPRKQEALLQTIDAFLKSTGT